MSRTFFAVCIMLMSTATMAEGDIAAGQTSAALCAACHGPDGNSTNPEWPSIAGQHENYLASQIKAVQSGERPSPLMAPMVATLSAQDIDNLAAYFASLPRRGMMANEAAMESVALGEKLYRGGNKESGIPACMSCHGPDGTGNNLAGFPMIATQHAKYTSMQLLAYRDASRANDPQGMMRDIAARLTDEEIEAVSEYLAGLRP